MSETAQPNAGTDNGAPTIAHSEVEMGTTSPERILATLDDAQRSAALAVDGPVRIIAGAGAGKTRTVRRQDANNHAAYRVRMRERGMGSHPGARSDVLGEGGQ